MAVSPNVIIFSLSSPEVTFGSEDSSGCRCSTGLTVVCASVFWFVVCVLDVATVVFVCSFLGVSVTGFSFRRGVAMVVFAGETGSSVL